MRRTSIAALTVLCFAALAGCKKEPGLGGKAEIRGKVLADEFDLNVGPSDTVATYYVHEARIYLVYGDHDFYDDDTRTGPDGLFQFSWLRKGDYTVFTYSDCPLCPGGVDVVEATVSIGDNKEQVVLPDLRVQIWH